MRILVTGATGRIGSRFVPRLLERGGEVHILTRQEARIEWLHERGVEVVRGDLLQPDTLRRALADVDAVIHLAAFFRSENEAQVRAITADGTVALTLAAVQAGIQRFVFTSTTLVYGPGRGRPAREDDEPQPTQVYPSSKVLAERALIDAHRRHKLGLRILRLAFVYGEGDPHLAEGLRWFRQWHPDKRFQLVHHADVAQALLLALDSPEGDGQIYNVADDSPVRVAEIMQFFGQMPAVEGATQLLDDSWEGIVDTARIRMELGYRPRYPSFFAAKEAGAL